MGNVPFPNRFKIRAVDDEAFRDILCWFQRNGLDVISSVGFGPISCITPHKFIYYGRYDELVTFGDIEEYFLESSIPEVWLYDDQLHFFHPKQSLTNRDLIHRQLAGDTIQIRCPFKHEWEDKYDTIFVHLSLLDEIATDYRIKPLESANNIMTTSKEYSAGQSIKPLESANNIMTTSKEYSAGQSINTIREMLEAIIDGQELEHIPPTALPNDWTDVTDVRFSVDQLDHPLMWDARVKLPKRMINGVEVPYSVDVDLLKVGQSIYIPDLGNKSMYSVKTWNDNYDSCINYKEREMIYLSVDDAVAHAKAWLGQETE